MLCELCAAAVARLEYMANASDDKIIIYYHYCSWFVRSAAAARDPRVLWRIVIRLWCSLWRRDPSTATRQPSPSIHSRFGVFRIFWTKRYLICMASLKYSNCICIFERFNWTKTLNTRSHWRSEQFKIGFFLYCRLPRLLLPGSLAPVSPPRNAWRFTTFAPCLLCKCLMLFKQFHFALEPRRDYNEKCCFSCTKSHSMTIFMSELFNNCVLAVIFYDIRRADSHGVKLELKF